mgnify:CR=1 FL=1
MIYTLTANPAIDYNIACDGLTANTVTRTRNAVYTPNGKGLNVSFTLDHYGVDTTILGFFAGFSGEFIVKVAEALGVPVYVTTADGSQGIRGFVTAALTETDYDFTYACGPEPMLKALYQATDKPGQYSFEARMACGFGVCMGCSCQTRYGSKRICKDGPVLKREEILW